VKEINGERLLRLRDPLGSFEWNGDWSEYSNKWTNELREVLRSHEKEFYMSFKDFVQHFETLDVCRVRNWDEVRVRGRFVRYADKDNTQEVV